MFLRMALLLCVSLATQVLCADEKASLRVRVVDTNAAPVADVKISVHRWMGTWERIDVAGATDKQGVAELSGIETDGYLTVAAEAAGLASTAQDMELAGGERREISIRMHKPAQGTVRVLDSQGQAVQGAVLSVLHFNAGEGGALFYRPVSTQPFPFEPTASDAQGVITLPPLPDGAKVELCVFHPDYLPKKVEGLRAFDGELTAVKLEKGVELRFKFTLGAGLQKMPDALQVTTNIDAFKVDGPRAPGLYLPMILSKTDWHCHVVPANYERLYVRSEDDDVTITPQIFADTNAFKSLLIVSDSQPHEVNFLVRKNQKVRGKVSGYVNGLGPDATAVGSTENLHPTLKAEGEKTNWVPVTFPDIAPDGSFELSLPPGKGKVRIGGLIGAIVEPAEFEFHVEPSKETILPEFKIRQLHNITGQLVDENQQPLAGAMARVFVGVWGSDYVTSDADGRFSLPPDLIINTAKHQESQMDISVIAFDPKSTKCGVLSITNNWQNAQELVIRCEPKPTGWLIQTFEEQMKRFWRDNREYREQQLQKRIAAFPQGAAGKTIPDFSSGTWLNSQVTSLKDFHGKYVLLDFWFIGCGPCEAELPTVTQLQELFGGERFTVVGVHVTAQTDENVRQFAAQHGMKYPIVVDNEDGDIGQAIEKLGIEGFPSYILLGPDGRIVQNDDQTAEVSLRMFKLEKLWSALQ